MGRNREQRGVFWMPWNRSSVLHKKGEGHFDNPVGLHEDAETVQVDPNVVAAHEATLPKMRRRTQRERAEKLATELFKDGLTSQKIYGYPVWPRSLQRIIEDAGVTDTNDLYAQVDALVMHFMLETENKQKEDDSHKVTRDWHAHFD
jgi:hypothetical protein